MRYNIGAMATLALMDAPCFTVRDLGPDIARGPGHKQHLARRPNTGTGAGAMRAAEREFRRQAWLSYFYRDLPK